MPGEQIILDPTSENASNAQLDITANADGYWLLEHTYPTPEDEEQWAGSADTEGDRKGSTRPRNRTITCKVRCRQPAGGTPAIGTIVGELEQKIAKLNREGGTYKRVLPSGDTIVFDVLSARIQVPADKSWVTRQRADVDLTFTCEPAGREPPLETLLDDFATDTIADYVFDVGAGTLSVSGGKLVPSSTARKQIYHDDFGRAYDFQVTLKVESGASVASWSLELFKRLDTGNFIAAVFNQAVGVSVRKLDGGVSTILSSVALGETLPASSSRWFRFRIEGSKVTAEYWTSAPTVAGTPLTTLTFTLTGADATKFGAAVIGDAGLAVTPGGTDWRFDDFTIEPNLFRETTLPVLTALLHGVRGDLPALVEIVVDNASGSQQMSAYWGIRSRYYNAAAALFLEAETLTPAGGAATAVGTATASGSGSNVVKQTTLGTGLTSMLNTGTLAHVGDFRVFARVLAPAANTGVVTVGFNWTPGALAIDNDPVTLDSALEGSWQLVDLGQIHLPERTRGNQEWSGAFLAASTVGSDDLEVDWLLLLPITEGSGEAHGVGVNGIIAATTGTLVLASDGVLYENGTKWDRPLKYEGDYPLIPAAGLENRKAELVVKTSRGSLDDGAAIHTDLGIDDIQIQAVITPRYLAVPTPA